MTVDPTGLAVGIYSGFVAIASPSAAQTPVLVPVVLSIANPSSLSVTKAHAGIFKQGLAGAVYTVYTVTVSNAASASATSTRVTASDTIPAGLTLVSTVGTDWDCTGNTCSRDDVLAPGASYPPITVTVNVNANAPTILINQVSVTTAGSPLATAADPTAVAATRTAPVLTAPADGATGVSTSPTLSWSAVPGATSHEVYLGQASPPVLVITTTGPAYTPSPLANSARYYWQIVAKNVGGSARSLLWTYTTQSSPTSGGPPVIVPIQCVSGVTPATLTVAGSGGTFSLAVKATAGCQWTVSGLPDWITPDPEASGTGSQTLNLQVAANSGGPRNAVLSLGSVQVTISQGVPCNCTLSSLGVGMPVAGGNAGTIGVTAAPDCVWAASAALAWVTLTGTATGRGSGIVSYQVGENTGVHRSGSITIGGAGFTFDQNGSAASSAGTMSHFASGGGWQTEFTLVNLGFGQSQAQVNFFDDRGNRMSASSATGRPNPVAASTKRLDVTPPLPSGSVVKAGSVLQVGLPISTSSSGTATGSAQLLTDGDIQGYGIIQLKVANGLQEAIVLPETRSSSAYFLPFDNTGGHFYGVSLSNTSGMPSGAAITIREAARSSIVLKDVVSLEASGHTAFLLADRFPATANIAGTMEIQGLFPGQISALGLRFNSNHAFTSVPLLTPGNEQGGTDLTIAGSLAHFSSGGGWKTVYTLVNTGAKPAKARLSFFGDDGKPLSISLHNPSEAGAADTESSVVDRTLSPGSVVLVETAGSSSQPQSGWARLQSNGSVSGFATLQYRTANGDEQEAVLSVESRVASSYVLPFDGTNGRVSGVAIANNSDQQTDITVTLRDSATGDVVGTKTLSLPAMGHTAFLLKDRYPSAANMNRTVEFSSPVGRHMSVWGIRVNSNAAFTSIPALVRQ